MEAKKRITAQDIVGWTSKDGRLKIIGIEGKDKAKKNTLFRVTCTECSKDPELFPLGYFISTKGHLDTGHNPCGCAKNYDWDETQYLILANRSANSRFFVHGFVEPLVNQNTKVICQCNVHVNFKWYPSIATVMKGHGCPECRRDKTSKINSIPHDTALKNCIDMCTIRKYIPIGFVGGEYKGSNTRFEYTCPRHGNHKVRYSCFINREHGCPKCAKEVSCFYGWYPERAEEQDFLYVLDFNGQYIKVGRSFDVDDRIKNGLQYKSGIRQINKLRVFTSTHRDIYKVEQELHEELKDRGFEHKGSDWSTETFDNDCLFVLNKLLMLSGLEEVL